MLDAVRIARRTVRSHHQRYEIDLRVLETAGEVSGRCLPSHRGSSAASVPQGPAVSLEVVGLCFHSLLATAATKALLLSKIPRVIVLQGGENLEVHIGSDIANKTRNRAGVSISV
jgi:hypothetical protein